MKNDDLLQTILESYDDSNYPEAFVSEYDIMECLSDQNGICTFLVQKKDGENCIAKCYDKLRWGISDNSTILHNLDHDGLPKHIATFESDTMTVTVREYVEGIPLSRYAKENDLPEREIVQICVRLCDILGYLHHREAPIIHRDIKPQNIIVRPDGSVALIDFDIARIYRSGNETDTMFFGTQAYAPPEQYGFSQTDARTDIYSLGVLLRWLLTGSTKENKNIRVYRPLARIISKSIHGALLLTFTFDIPLRPTQNRDPSLMGTPAPSARPEGPRRHPEGSGPLSRFSFLLPVSHDSSAAGPGHRERKTGYISSHCLP